MIRAILFDLDDTLFDQGSWLDGAWRAVARAASGYGIEAAGFEDALRRVAAAGSDRGNIIDRALDLIGAGGRVPVAPLVTAFRRHRAARLELYPGVARVLDSLPDGVRLGLVTDGDPTIQRGKLAALGLSRRFDAVVLTDTLGRHYRKPHPRGFILALARLGVRAGEVVMIGDRPDKDVAGAQTAGIRAIRVRTGEYSGAPDVPTPWRSVASVVEAVACVRPDLAPAHAVIPSGNGRAVRRDRSPA
jgi:putative hydrolase of the HAD superfamily